MVYAIIIVTAAVSILCFRNPGLFDRLALSPYLVFKKRQFDRIITHGFVHADWPHLLINMFVFWSFGEYVLYLFNGQVDISALNPNVAFGLLYFGGLIFASLYDVIRRRDTPRYVSVGASGAVSAVVFASIFYNPLGKILFFAIIPIPGIVFGLLYLAYEGYSARHTSDRINHHAHIFGALYGFIFPMLIGGFDQFHIFLSGLGIK